MSNSPTIEYFGKDTVEMAITDYFETHGITERTRDNLMMLAINSEDDFFQMVCNFIENKG